MSEVEEIEVEVRDAERLAKDYSAMGDSVALINAIIAGDSMADESAEDRQDCVDRNVQHLELMVAKDDWGSEDMTAVNAAIAAAEAAQLWKNKLKQQQTRRQLLQQYRSKQSKNSPHELKPQKDN